MHICITNREDELIWKYSLHGSYTPKLGYIQLNIELHLRDPSWWWKGIWKEKFPLNSSIFMWCMIMDQVPTWDRMKMRQVGAPFAKPVRNR